MPIQKILVIAESIDVDDSSGSKANVALIQNLKKAGFDLRVLHYTRKDIQLDGVMCLNLPENRSSMYFFLSRIQRKLQHWFKWNLAKYLEPVFGFSFTFFNDIRSIYDELNKLDPASFDLVLTLSKGASFRPHYALLKAEKFQHIWMAYIHDPYPFHYYPEPYRWSEPGFNKKIKFFKELSENCRWAAFPSLLLEEWMTEKFRGFKNRSLVIPHQLVEEEQTFHILPDYFEAEKFTLLHAGNLMKQRSPFYLIQAFQLFLKEFPTANLNAELLLIGNASYYIDKLQKAASEIPQLSVKKYLDFQKMKSLQNSVSVNIILESISEISPFLPGKFPHCIKAEKPILLLGPRKSESHRLLGEDYPYWSEANDVNGIKNAIIKLYEEWQKNKGRSEMPRPDMKNYLSSVYLQNTLKNLI